MKYTVLDLFAGCGGLTEGFMETNKYNFLAHVEWEKPMIDTLRRNLVKRWNYSSEEAFNSVIQFDVQKINELINGDWNDETKRLYEKNNSQQVVANGLNSIIKQSVDVIIGGPPCQAYSLAGRAQDPNSMKDDYRNYLFESFVSLVDEYQPKVFVFENVPGILSAKPGNRLVIERIYEAFDEIGYEIRKPSDMKNSIYTSANYNVPQDRRRVIIFGVKKGSNIQLEDLYRQLTELKSEHIMTVRDAIGQMPKFYPLEKSYKEGKSNVSHRLEGLNDYDLNIPRYVNDRDRETYKEWIEKSLNKATTEEKIEFYYSKTGKKTNHNKYRSLEWDKPSPTIVSHLQKDGHMFIHPDSRQCRSITIREAAKLQSFPDDYEFIGSNPYCFKMIGNAVPVLFSKAIGNAVATILDEVVDKNEKK